MGKFKTAFERKIEQINLRKEQQRNQKSMDYSIKEGSGFSVMAGFGQNYLSAFAIALGASNTALAMLNSLPVLISNFFQPFGIKIAEKQKTRKKLILDTVLLQALSWIPLFILPLIFKEYNVWFLITFVVVYHVLGAMHAPLWGSMMTDIVTHDARGRYFGRRNKIIGSIAFFSGITAGLILFLFENINVWVGFGVLFSIAFAGRLYSYHYMKKIFEPKYNFRKKKQFTPKEFIKSLHKTNYGKFVFATSILRFAVHIAAPFFAAFILRELGFSYFQYTLIISVAGVSSFMTMYYWGRHSDRHGHKVIMTVTGWLIPLVPLVWAVTNSFYGIVVAQVISGVAWAGFQLSESNYLYEAVSPEKRARGIAYHNVSRGIMVFLGSIVGAALINYVPKLAFQVTNLQMIFLISAGLRLIAVLIYFPMFKHLREIENRRKDYEVFIDLVAVRPVSGLIIKTRAHVEYAVKIVESSTREVTLQVKKVFGEQNKEIKEDIVNVKDKVNIRFKHSSKKRSNKNK